MDRLAEIATGFILVVMLAVVAVLGLGELISAAVHAFAGAIGVR